MNSEKYQKQTNVFVEQKVNKIFETSIDKMYFFKNVVRKVVNHFWRVEMGSRM
jgi:hypothetical protein